MLDEGKPKWQTILKDIESNTKRMKKKNWSSSTQLIGLDEEEEENNGSDVLATVPKINQQVMWNKWKKDRVVREGVARKNFPAWMGIFSTKEV